MAFQGREKIVQPLDVQRAPEGGEVGAVQSGWRLALREFMSNRLAVIGFGILVFFVLFCFVGPLIYHTNQLTPTSLTRTSRRRGSTCSAPTTDGFDELGRIMKGGQAALEVGFFAAFVAITIGAMYGAVAGLAAGICRLDVDARGGRVPFRAVPVRRAHPGGQVRRDGAVAVPGHRLLLLAGAGQAGPRRGALAPVTRLRPGRANGGAGRWRLISKHLLPNAIGVVIVNVTFQVADAILAVSYIGFLGFGLHFPNVDWGDQLSDGIGYLQDGYWWLIFPVGACIVLTVMALNFIGDALRDATDVRLRRR